MTDREKFLAAIRREPGEESHRLVFADWLEERGGEGWAYLIRHGGDAPTVCPEGMSADVCVYPGPAAGTHYTVKLAEGIRGVSFVVRKGFVDEVRLSCSSFCGGPCAWCRNVEHNYPTEKQAAVYAHCPDCSGTGTTPGLARAIFAAHPVVSVVCTDKHSENLGYGWAWRFEGVDNGPESLPDELRHESKGDPDDTVWVRVNPDDCLAALNLRCVRYGRNFVGLPSC